MDYKDLKVVIILRNYNLDEIDFILENIEKTNIKNIEITANTKNYLEILEKMIKKYTSLNIGVGTVINLEEAKLAIEKGAKFILSPIVMDKEMIKYCNLNDVVPIPGAFSPSEMYKMIEYGANLVKLFPASNLGVDYIKSIKSPLNNLDIMCVGGISVDNIKEYKKIGIKYFGIGSSLFSKEDIINRNSFKIQKKLKELEREIFYE